MRSIESGDRLRVRLLQTDPVLGAVEANLAHLDERVAAAGECDLVVAPELATHGYHLSDLPDSVPLASTDPRLLALGGHGPAVVVGFAEGLRHHQFNSAVLVHDGRVVVQRKLFLPTYRGWEERKNFRPGGGLECHDLLGTRLAILICNDAWQPAIPWLAAHGGAEIMVVVVNSARSEVGVPTDRAWDVLLTHTAVMLQSYVVFVNRSGQESNRDFWGGSRVIDPTGAELVRLGEAAGEIDCDLDLPGLRTLRRQWPLLQESRADLVAKLAGRLADEES